MIAPSSSLRSRVSRPLLLLLLVVQALWSVGCATTKVPRPAQFPYSAKDWHDIDSVEFLKDFRLEDYSRLVLEPFDTSSTWLPPKDENTHEAAVVMLKRADNLLLTEIPRGLRRGKASSPLELTDNKPAPEALDRTLLLHGKVVRVDPGSRSARYWVGFGAGSAHVRIKGEILDAKSGTPLLRFEQQRIGTAGAFGGDYEGLLTDCLVVIGRDIGRLLAVFSGPEPVRPAP